MSDCQHNNSGYGLKTEDVQTKGQLTADRTREALVDALSERLDRLSGDVDITEIEEILAEIDSFGPVADDVDVEASLAQFYEDAFEDTEVDEAPLPNNAKPRRHRGLARIAIIAAALVCIAVTTTQASGLEFFQAIINWANETFHIASEVEPERNESTNDSYVSLKDVLDGHGVTIPLVPKEFPQDTRLLDLKVKDTKGVLAIVAVYDSSGDEIHISIRQIDPDRHNDIEADVSNEVEPYVVGRTTYNLVTDVNQEKAIWRNGEWECNISTTLNREQLKAMIDSI